MATLISTADGNFTASGTWALCDSTSELDAENANTAVGTAYSSNRSSTFTPGAITIDGIAVKLATRAASPSGTFSVSLYNSTLAADVAGTEVTINVSDLPTNTLAADFNGGWQLFKFSAPVLLIVATAYRVQCKCSVNGEVTLFRDGTATNWSRQLRTTTNQAPASGDKILVSGWRTGAGSITVHNVVMDETATTAYGGITISYNGNFQFGVSASTNYNLYISGLAMGATSGKRGIEVCSGGIFTMGTADVSMPSTSTATLQFTVGSNVEFGLEIRNGGIYQSIGAELTNYTAFLASDASGGATSLTTDVSTGGLNGDEIALAPTTRTFSQYEKKSLTANASGTTLTISAITNARSGTAPTRAKLANLTRNVKIRGASASLQTFIAHYKDALFEAYRTEFYWMGSSTTGKRGINTNMTTNGIFTVVNCSIHDFEVGNSIGLFIDNATIGGVYLDGNVFYNTFFGAIVQGSTQGTFNNNTIIGVPGSGANGVLINRITVTITNNHVCGCSGAGIYLGQSAQTLGTFENNTVHTNNATGILIAGAPIGGTLYNSTCWRNVGYGINAGSAAVIDVTFDTAVLFGNSTAGMNVGPWYNVICKTVTFEGDSSFAQPYGVVLSNIMKNSVIANSTFSATTSHSIGDINWNANYDLYTSNCTFAASTLLSNIASRPSGVFARFQKYQQTNGSHRNYGKYLTTQTDTSIYASSSPSIKITPNVSSPYKATPDFDSFIKVPVTNGASVTISVKVRKSVVGDGAAYNGDQPRLMVAASFEGGVTSNTVLATSTVSGDGAFETLTATTATATDNCVFCFYVDCNGTAGWINIDDVTISKSNDTTGTDFWLVGEPFVSIVKNGLIRHPGMTGGMNG